MNHYMVATHVAQRSESVVPEGKRHAYRAGARTTACGFALDAMRRFAEVPFSVQPPGARCPICARAVGGDH